MTEATEELATAHDKIGELELRLAGGGADHTPRGTTPSIEAGFVIVRELEDARDEALEALDCAQWEIEKLKREHEVQVLQIKESVREELEKKYERDLRTRDEIDRANADQERCKEKGCPLRCERGWGPELRRRVTRA